MIDSKTQKKILAEYDGEVAIYKDLAATSASLLENISLNYGVQLHSITHRRKSRSSLAAKISKPDKEYDRLGDITDLAAVRIITYFADDVDKVAEIVEREFSVDPDNSIDKRKFLDPDRFGYQSLHYVVTFIADRCKLSEYSRFNYRKVEIQIRSILQHAWAEIEHDLGYKSAVGIPKDIRRRFSRIAGLLELADNEFSAIRHELDSYARTVPSEIQNEPENVGIDKISLNSLLQSEGSSIRKASLSVANAAGAVLKKAAGDEHIDIYITNIGLLGITTIAELEHAATTHLARIEKFAKYWLEEKQYDTMYEGVGLLYLAYVLLAEQGDVSRIVGFAKGLRLSGNHKKTANRIIEVYQKSAPTG